MVIACFVFMVRIGHSVSQSRTFVSQRRNVAGKNRGGGESTSAGKGGGETPTIR